MTDTPTTFPSPLPLRKTFSPAVVLILLCVILFGQRIRTYYEPFESDIATYAIIGDGMLHGRALYSDLWDIKPPAIYLSYAASQLIVGKGRPSVFFANILMAMATLFGIFAAGRAMGKTPGAGVWGAVFWTAISADLYLQANQPNAEVFLNACMVWSLVFLAWQMKSREDAPPGMAVPHAMKPSITAAIGILLLLASLYKTFAFVGAFFLVLSWALALPASVPWTRRLFHIFAIITIGALGWLAVLAYYAKTQRYDIFIATIFTYGRAYAGSLSDNIVQALHPDALLPNAFRFMLPLILLSFAGLVVGLQKKQRPWWILWLGYWAAAWFMRALPGQAHPHYYQLWLPPFAIGADWALQTITWSKLREKISLSHVLATACAIFLFGYGAYQMSFPSNQWSRLKYGDWFWEAETLAPEINRLLQPNETFFLWGDRPNLYFATGRQPVSGVFWIHHVLHGSLTRQLSERMLASLQAAPPDLLVEETVPMLIALSDQHPVAQWLDDNYTEIPYGSERGMFQLCARKGSALEARLNAFGSPFEWNEKGQGPEIVDRINQRSITITPDVVNGSLDAVGWGLGYFEISGHAEDLSLTEPATRILVFSDKNFVWSGSCTMSRMDVAFAFNEPLLEHCGFSLRIPMDQMPIDGGFHVYAVNSQNVATEIISPLQKSGGPTGPNDSLKNFSQISSAN